MKFSLIYHGPLLAKNAGTGPRLVHQHQIRKAIHRQLVDLWKFQYPLPSVARFLNPYVAQLGVGARTLQETLVKSVGSFQFVPLVSTQTGLVCRLEILFLRRSSPGDIITHGGDLDNRLKTLFDALRIPGSTDNLSPEEGEVPFLCLLQDDALITEVNVTTDRLLGPSFLETEEGQNDVHLVIRVETMVFDRQKAEMFNLQ
jgi:hypothetical protein